MGSIVVLGPNINLSEAESGYYGPRNCCTHGGKKYWNVVDAVSKYAPGSVVSYAAIDNPKAGKVPPNNMSRAVNMSRAADTVVLAVGTDLYWAQEGWDAGSIAFSDGQMELINATAVAASIRWTPP